MSLSVDTAQIGTTAAHAAVAAAVGHARTLGIAINVAVTDGSGTLMAFLRMNDGRPALPPKRTRPGQVLRRRLLARHGFASADAQWFAWRRETGLRASDAALDDALDAAAVCRTALLIYRGEACHLPERIERDRHGLPMAIWY